MKLEELLKFRGKYILNISFRKEVFDQLPELEPAKSILVNAFNTCTKVNFRSGRIDDETSLYIYFDHKNYVTDPIVPEFNYIRYINEHCVTLGKCDNKPLCTVDTFIDNYLLTNNLTKSKYLCMYATVYKDYGNERYTATYEINLDDIMLSVLDGSLLKEDNKDSSSFYCEDPNNKMISFYTVIDKYYQDDLVYFINNIITDDIRIIGNDNNSRHVDITLMQERDYVMIYKFSVYINSVKSLKLLYIDKDNCITLVASDSSYRYFKVYLEDEYYVPMMEDILKTEEKYKRNAAPHNILYFDVDNCSQAVLNSMILKAIVEDKPVHLISKDRNFKLPINVSYEGNHDIYTCTYKITFSHITFRMFEKLFDLSDFKTYDDFVIKVKIDKEEFRTQCRTISGLRNSISRSENIKSNYNTYGFIYVKDDSEDHTELCNHIMDYIKFPLLACDKEGNISNIRFYKICRYSHAAPYNFNAYSKDNYAIYCVYLPTKDYMDDNNKLVFMDNNMHTAYQVKIYKNLKLLDDAIKMEKNKINQFDFKLKEWSYKDIVESQYTNEYKINYIRMMTDLSIKEQIGKDFNKFWRLFEDKEAVKTLTFKYKKASTSAAELSFIVRTSCLYGAFRFYIHPDYNITIESIRNTFDNEFIFKIRKNSEEVSIKMNLRYADFTVNRDSLKFLSTKPVKFTKFEDADFSKIPYNFITYDPIEIAMLNPDKGNITGKFVPYKDIIYHDQTQKYHNDIIDSIVVYKQGIPQHYPVEGIDEHLYSYIDSFVYKSSDNDIKIKIFSNNSHLDDYNIEFDVKLTSFSDGIIITLQDQKEFNIALLREIENFFELSIKSEGLTISRPIQFKGTSLHITPKEVKKYDKPISIEEVSEVSKKAKELVECWKEYINYIGDNKSDNNTTDDIKDSPIIQEFIEKYGLTLTENKKEGNKDTNECTNSVSFELTFKNPYVNSSKNENAKKIIDFLKKSIDKVIFKGRTTRVVWKDGSVTEVTAQKDDEFNKEQGVTLCIFKMLMGNTYHYYDLIKYLVDKADKDEADRRKKKEEKLAKKAEAKRKKQMEEAKVSEEAAIAEVFKEASEETE